MSKGLGKVQRATLKLLESLSDDSGYSYTVLDVAKELNVQKSSAYRALMGLIKLGLVQREAVPGLKSKSMIGLVSDHHMYIATTLLPALEAHRQAVKDKLEQDRLKAISHGYPDTEDGLFNYRMDCFFARWHPDKLGHLL